jgi:hypothetical protein
MGMFLLVGGTIRVFPGVTVLFPGIGLRTILRTV